MGQLQTYKEKMSGQMRAMRANQSVSDVVQGVGVFVVGAGIGYAESKTGSTNVAPMVAVAGATAAFLTSGTARLGAKTAALAGAAIAGRDLAHKYAAGT